MKNWRVTDATENVKQNGNRRMVQIRMLKEIPGEECKYETILTDARSRSDIRWQALRFWNLAVKAMSSSDLETRFFFESGRLPGDCLVRR
jgi:hypothetical protein